MTKNDYIALIIEHLVNQGYKSTDDFVFYITECLPKMSMQTLANELEFVENRA